MTTDKSRADALTDQIDAAMELAHRWATAAYHKGLSKPYEDFDEIRKQLRIALRELAVSPVEQPAAEPVFSAGTCYCYGRSAAHGVSCEYVNGAPKCRQQPAAAPPMKLLGETRESGVVWFDQNPHAFPIGTKFYAASDEQTAAAPIPMLLFCPRCGTQHVDAPETEPGRLISSGPNAGRVVAPKVTWDNPPHRSHLCHACGIVWRPADVATVGVKSIETRGKADTWTDSTQWIGHNRPIAVDPCMCSGLGPCEKHTDGSCRLKHNTAPSRADERSAFESRFKMPSQCVRCGDGYVATGYEAWDASAFILRWEGWQARAAYANETAMLIDANVDLGRAVAACEHEVSLDSAAAMAAQPARAWETDDGRVISDEQKQQALRDGGASASSVRPFSIALGRIGAVPATAAEAVGEIVTFGPELKECSWRAGKMPEVGTKLYAAPQAGWRELCRRLYVELFHCDQQMRSTRDEDGEPHWTQSAVVRDVLADAKAALDGAPAQEAEAVAIGEHDLSTSAGGRGYIAEFFAKRLRRHDFGRYINERLAADFACALAQYLRDRVAVPQQPTQADTIQCQAHSGPDCIECGGTGVWRAQADARVGLTDLLSAHVFDCSGGGCANAELIHDLRALLATHPGQPEPRQKCHGCPINPTCPSTTCGVPQPEPRAEVMGAGAMNLKRFAGLVLKDHRNDGYPGDVDGDALQRYAEQCGLIEQRKVDGPCASGCSCADVGEFPTVCFFNTDLGKSVINAAHAGDDHANG